jgi:hypothetical protein
MNISKAAQPFAGKKVLHTMCLMIFCCGSYLQACEAPVAVLQQLQLLLPSPCQPFQLQALLTQLKWLQTCLIEFLRNNLVGSTGATSN